MRGAWRSGLALEPTLLSIKDGCGFTLGFADLAMASEEEWISMVRSCMEGGVGGSVLQNAGTEVFDFLRIRVYVREQEVWLTRYLNRFSVRSGDKQFGCM